MRRRLLCILLAACDAFFRRPHDDHDEARKADAALRVLDEDSQRPGTSVWVGPLTDAQANSLVAAGCAHFGGMTLAEMLAPDQTTEPPTPP